jgi:hypothetical protein
MPAGRRPELPPDRRSEPVGQSTASHAGLDLAVVLTRAEMDALAATLVRRLRASTPRLDSPARVQAALVELIRRTGGRGRPLVVRSPAGLYTPEYWHIRIDDADPVTRDEVGRLVGGRRTD